jgi:hypothetical protein
MKSYDPFEILGIYQEIIYKSGYLYITCGQEFSGYEIELESFRLQKLRNGISLRYKVENGIVIYAIINTVIRNLDQNIITPWITLNVQNVNAPLAPLTPHTHTAPIATRIAHSAHDTRIAMATDIEIGVADISSCEEDHKYIPRQYEISITNTIYSWFDWLIYIHMLLAQIDMFLIEVFTDILAICIVTRWYIKNKTV